MSLQTWCETLVTGQVDGPSLNNSLTATSIIPTHAKITLPQNYFYIGRKLHVRLAGRLSNIVTTPGTLTIDFRLGAVVAFNGGAMNLSTTAHTTLPFWCELSLTCRAIGSGTSANLMGQGWFESQCVSLTSTSDNASTIPCLLIPNTAPAVGTGFDSTAANTVDVFATFSVQNAGNLIQVHQFEVTALN